MTTSTFLSADPRSLWWGAGSTRRCATNGRTFIESLQGALHVTVDGKWGESTSTAVIAQMQLSGMPSEIINAAATEARRRTVGQFLVLGGIYVVMSQVQNDPVPLGSIGLDSGMVLPRWNIAPPGVGGVGIECFAVETHPIPQVDEQVPPPDATPEQPPIDVYGNVTPNPPRAPSTQRGSFPVGLAIFVAVGVGVTSLLFKKKRK